MSASGHRHPSGSGRPGSRSSRRILSSAAPVELGGGVGILGSALTDEAAYQAALHAASRTGASPPPPPHYNVYSSRSPTESSFSHSSQSRESRDSIPPPAPPKDKPPQRVAAAAAAAGQQSLPLPHLSQWSMSTSSSGRSFASAASTQPAATPTRTPNKKVERAKADSSPYSHSHSQNGSHHQSQSQSTSQSHSHSSHSRHRKEPSQGSIGSGSSPSRHPQQRSKRVSPAAEMRREEPVAGPADRMRTAPPPPLPAMAQGPLPQTPSDFVSEAAAFKNATVSKLKGKKKLPTPIRTGHEPTLSQDWVRIDEFDDQTISKLSPARPAPAPPAVPPARDFMPAPSMIPLAPEHRPRVVTDPLPHGPSRGQRSFDMARSVTPTSTGRKTPNGMDSYANNNGRRTPNGLGEPSGRRTPNGIGGGDPANGRRTPTGVNANDASNTGTRTIQFSRPAPPPPQQTIKPRRSMDLLRTHSRERDGSSKDTKAAAQRGLGVGHPEPKTPGLNLKKSSGALRNLFRSKGSKDMGAPTDAPDMPRPSISDLFRPSISLPRATSPNPSPIISGSSVTATPTSRHHGGDSPSSSSPSNTTFSYPYLQLQQPPQRVQTPPSQQLQQPQQPQHPQQSQHLQQVQQLQQTQHSQQHRYPTPPPRGQPGSTEPPAIRALPVPQRPKQQAAQQPQPTKPNATPQQQQEPRREHREQQQQQQQQQQDQQRQQQQRQQQQLEQKRQQQQRQEQQRQQQERQQQQQQQQRQIDQRQQQQHEQQRQQQQRQQQREREQQQQQQQQQQQSQHRTRPSGSRALPPLPTAQPEPTRGYPQRLPMANAMQFETPQPSRRDLSKDSASPAASDGSSSTVRQVTAEWTPGESQSPPGSSPQLLGSDSPANWSPIKPSQSLRLLQLPELDLAFDISFDNLGVGNSSPTTPRKRSPTIVEQPHSPSRSRSISHGSVASRTPSDHRKQRTERRRSKSFDGPSLLSMGSETPWRQLDFDQPQSWSSSKFFTASSTSAPKLSSTPPPPAAPPAEQLSPADDGVSPTSASRSDGGLGIGALSLDVDSVSTHNSLVDHTRTPSGGSSTHETSSPSPPRTPEDAHSHPAFLGSTDTAVVPKTATLDPPVHLEPPMELGQPFETAFSTPPKSSPNPGAVTITTSSSTSTATVTPEPLANVVVPEPPATPAKRKYEPYVNPAKPPKETPDPKEPDQLPPSKAPFRARPTVRHLVNRATVINPDPNITLRDLTAELERALEAFRFPMPSGGAERSMIIRNELLVYIAEVDKRCYLKRDEVYYFQLRDVFFDWAEILLFELRVEQPANERGACLEGLAAILESSCLSAEALEASPAHQDAFLQLMMKVMNFVMDKLGAKGVFHNTLLFSGRFLAFAFFRIPHVGGQLVGVLQPPRGALMRFTRPVLMGKTIASEAMPRYPAHLQSLCFDNSHAYTRRLLSLDPDFDTASEKEAFHFQPGNWLRRWQSDDSELFPAFYRAYHRQLALYLAPAVEYYQLQGKPVPAHVLLRAPGYAHLATIFAKKCHSYVLGSVNAVTTSSSNQHFDATESAGFRGSQKPAVLETANRRLVETLWTFASSLVAIPSASGYVLECDGAQLWGEMIDLWTKNLINKTSLYAPKGVFCLFDLVDGIVDPVILGAPDSPLDVPYLIGMVRLILNEAEHALTIVKAVAFVFTHWEILTARPEDRHELCLDILLNKKLFERLLLYWSQSVRSYVLRLVVFRLGHLHTTKADGASYDVEIESVRLLQTRLDNIKRRHDELEPNTTTPEATDVDGTPRTPTSGGGMPRSRSTITMVTDSPQPQSRAEKLLGMSSTQPDDDTSPKNKAASWWKRTIGKPGKKATKRSPPSSTTQTVPLSGPAAAAPPAASSSPQNTSSVLGTSPVSSISSPINRPTKLEPSPLLQPSPLPRDSPEISGPPSPRRRKAPPPHIAVAKASAQFAFEFELPTASPLSDTFDANATPTSPNGRRSSQPPSPRGTTSPHMSHSFSKRSSLLPPPTASMLDAMAIGLKLAPPVPRDPGYPKRLHAYAIRMLAELEDAQKEYDEWWSEGGIGKVDGAPPRLAVAWPFHEGEE